MGAPVPYTCPHIDGLIKNVNALLALSNSAREDINFAEEISHYLFGFEADLEDLRSANNALRRWGDMLEDKLNDITIENKALKKVNESLKQAMRSCLEDLEEKLNVTRGK